MTEQPSSNPPPADWREARRQERHERRTRRGGRSGVAGLTLLVLGVIFMARNLGYPVPDRWWAFFVLLPGLVSLGVAWRLYQQGGGVTSAGVISLALGGILLVVLAALFYMGMDLGKYWPVVLIGLGLVAFLGGGRRSPPA